MGKKQYKHCRHDSGNYSENLPDEFKILEMNRQLISPLLLMISEILRCLCWKCCLA